EEDVPFAELDCADLDVADTGIEFGPYDYVRHPDHRGDGTVQERKEWEPGRVAVNWPGDPDDSSVEWGTHQMDPGELVLAPKFKRGDRVEDNRTASGNAVKRIIGTIIREDHDDDLFDAFVVSFNDGNVRSVYSHWLDSAETPKR